jgi:hypothetical protein
MGRIRGVDGRVLVLLHSLAFLFRRLVLSFLTFVRTSLGWVVRRVRRVRRVRLERNALNALVLSILCARVVDAFGAQMRCRACLARVAAVTTNDFCVTSLAASVAHEAASVLAFLVGALVRAIRAGNGSAC